MIGFFVKEPTKAVKIVESSPRVGMLAELELGIRTIVGERGGLAFR
jgi:hypothetical protein